MKLSKFILILFCLQVSIVNAQETDVKKASISDQFDYIIRKSTNFNEKGQTYEVVRLDLLMSVKAAALDSVKVVQAKLKEARKGISPLEEEIKGLKANLSASQKSLAIIKEEKDNMYLLGMPISKESYKVVMWSIIIILIVFLVFFIYRFKNSNAVTKTAQNTLEDLENEFKEHRSAALIREQKAMRQLQDELNKQKK